MTTSNDQLLKAAPAGDLAGVSQALEQGANVNAKDEYNNTSLNGAALWGHAEVVTRLVEAGADIENQGSGGGMTPLANAASRGHSDVAQRGIDVTAAASLLPALLSDADPDTRGQAGRALTHHLARVGDWPQVKEILASTDVRLRLAASEALIRAEGAP